MNEMNLRGREKPQTPGRVRLLWCSEKPQQAAARQTLDPGHGGCERVEESLQATSGARLQANGDGLGWSKRASE